MDRTPLAYRLPLHSEAPGISLELSAWTVETLADIEEGRVDFALYTDEALPPGFQHQALFEESFAFLLRDDHPILETRNHSGHIAPSTLALLPRVVLLYPDGTETGIDDPLSEYGRPLGHGDLRTPHFLSAPLSLRGSDFVLCVPRRMAHLVAAANNLAVVNFPERERITYCMVWHDRAERDLSLMWLRERLRTMFM